MNFVMFAKLRCCKLGWDKMCNIGNSNNNNDSNTNNSNNSNNSGNNTDNDTFIDIINTYIIHIPYKPQTLCSFVPNT